MLDEFVERCPAAVMVRATVERLYEIFEAHRSRQSEREIVGSELVVLMATWTHPSVPASYLAARKTLGISVTVSGKLACFEPRVTAVLVRDSTINRAWVIAALLQERCQVLPGRTRSRCWTRRANWS